MKYERIKNFLRMVTNALPLLNEPVKSDIHLGIDQVEKELQENDHIEIPKETYNNLEDFLWDKCFASTTMKMNHSKKLYMSLYKQLTGCSFFTGTHRKVEE